MKNNTLCMILVIFYSSTVSCMLSPLTSENVFSPLTGSSPLSRPSAPEAIFSDKSFSSLYQHSLSLIFQKACHTLKTREPLDQNTIELLQNYADEHQNTLLHNAVQTAEIAEIQLLIQCSISINHINDYGRTALHYARNADIAKILLCAGSNDTVVDNEGYSPLGRARLQQITLCCLMKSSNLSPEVQARCDSRLEQLEKLEKILVEHKNKKHSRTNVTNHEAL